MKRFLGALLAALLVFGLGGSVRADDQDAKAILDKAIKALGGEEKLSKVEAVTWKSKGTITLNGEDHEISTHVRLQGFDHIRSEFEGDFNGNLVKGVTVLNVDEGWRKFGDRKMPFDEPGVANEKRSIYLQLIPITLVPLKGKDFQVEAAGEEKVGDAPAVGLKVKGPDGKDFKIDFNKESGLPVRVTVRVVGFGNTEFDMETTYANYKEFGGIKKATKIESKRDGEKFLEAEISDFAAVDKFPAETFAEPK